MYGMSCCYMCKMIVQIIDYFIISNNSIYYIVK